MKITIFAHRWIRALARLCGGAAFAPRYLHRQTARVIQLPTAARRAARGPVIRWRMNPVSGRLECRWTVVGNPPDAEASHFERFGAILAIRQRGRAWD
jgi:hypothetical protein